MNDEQTCRIGIDLGETKTEALLLAVDGTVVHRSRRVRPLVEGYEGEPDKTIPNLQRPSLSAPVRFHESCRWSLLPLQRERSYRMVIVPAVLAGEELTAPGRQPV